MKFLSTLILLLLALAPAAAQGPRPAPAPPVPRAAEDFALERRVAAAPGVIVSLCLASGDVVVRGWERDEVRARTSEGGALALQTDGGQPARRVEVMADEESEGGPRPGDCGVTNGLELAVPRGATVNLRVQEGDVEVWGVAELTVNNLSGDVDVRGVSRAADVTTMSGDISVAESKGRARLRAVSGSVEALNVAPVAEGDTFEASSTSGDVELDGVRHARVNGSAISGSVRMSGALARGGTYDFKTISGDVTLTLPADSSFSLNAKVVLSGQIVTDFSVRTASTSSSGEDTPSPPSPPDPPARPKHGKRDHPDEPQPTRLVGTVGAGDAAISLSSFSGTLHLKRQ